MAMKPIEILINAKDNASGVFDRLNNKLKVVGVAIAGYFGIKAFAGIVEGAADFEQALSRVKAATGASAEEMERLKQAAQDAGASTKYTSTEAANALENLAKAGLSAGDAIETLPAVLALAQAGDIELATSAEYVTKAVMGMGLAFSDAARVADVLALGANATNTSVEGLAQALSYAAPTANSLGVSLESTVAIIGKFADAGIDASRAGTALNSIMSQFSDPASKFRKELAAIGITTGDFEQALHQMADSGARGSKAINAVGLEAGPALKALLNQGMPALDELKAKLDSAAGSAAATAKTMEDNLKGSMTGLASAWDTVKNVLGTPVLPVIKDGVDQLAGALRSAVSDGTIQKFGEAIATAFQAGIKWVKEFLGQVDFAQVTERMRGFADRAGEIFTQVGEYATNAGNIVKTAYGVMSAGTNAVLASIYGIGSVFSEMASVVMGGVAKLRDGLATVTFGKLSESFKLAADDARNMAQGFGEAAQAMRDKASSALGDVADAAQMARDGFGGLVSGAEGAGAALGSTRAKLDAVAASMGAQSAELVKLRSEYEALASGGGLIASADKLDQITAMLAKGSPEAKAHALAIGKMREEYDLLAASGNIDEARAKLLEIGRALGGQESAADAAWKAIRKLESEYEALQTSGNLAGANQKMVEISAALRAMEPAAAVAVKAFGEVGKAASDAGDAAAKLKREQEAAAAAIAAAYKDLGITTDASLKEVADRAQKNFELLASSGKASARELAQGFEDAAKKAIAANNGIAPSWVTAQAGARGYVLEVDAVGKTTVKSMDDAKSAVDSVTKSHAGATGAAHSHAAAVGGVTEAYSGAAAAAGAAAANFAKAKAASEKTINPKAGQTGGDGTVIPEFDTMEELDAWVDEWKKNFRDDDRLVGVNSDGFVWYQRLMDEAHKKAAQSLKSREVVKQAGDEAKRKKDPQAYEIAGAAGRTDGVANGVARTPVAERATYVSNITIPGVGSASLNFSDASSQRQAEELLRQLAQAKSTAIR